MELLASYHRLTMIIYIRITCVRRSHSSLDLQCFWLFSDDTMSLSSIVKKASSLLRLGSSDSLKPPPLDGEIIYCKNNVCVHPPASLLVDSEHHPGYLTLRAHQSEVSSRIFFIVKLLTLLCSVSLLRGIKMG